MTIIKIFHHATYLLRSFLLLCLRRWQTLEEAIEAARLVHVNKVLGVHYDTFGFIQIDKAAATAAFAEAGIQLYLPAIGETIELSC